MSYPKTEMMIILFLFIEQETTVGRCFEIFHHVLAHRWKLECINWKINKIKDIQKFGFYKTNAKYIEEYRDITYM